jgi:hypothetical protein
MTAVAIARTTGVYTLLFNGLSGHEGRRDKIGVTGID